MNKKIIFVEVVTLVLALGALAIYFSPRFLNNREVMMAAKIKSDNAVFTSKALEEFAQNKDAKSSEVAQKVLDELNEKGTNPYNRKIPPYTFETNCKGCSSVQFDDDTEMIIVTTYDKKGVLVARTVIKPPSFVTYLKPSESKKFLFDFRRDLVE